MIPAGIFVTHGADERGPRVRFPQQEQHGTPYSYEAAELLVALARTGRVQADLEEAFLEAAERVSAYERDRVLATLLRARRW